MKQRVGGYFQHFVELELSLIHVSGNLLTISSVVYRLPCSCMVGVGLSELDVLSLSRILNKCLNIRDHLELPTQQKTALTAREIVQMIVIAQK